MKLNFRLIRMFVVVLLVGTFLYWVWHTDLRPERINLLIAALIGAVTSVYALFTYEILVQNQAMAQAALDSATLMEQSLRFSHAANLIFETVVTKDPSFKSHPGSVTPVDNPDFKRALGEYSEEGKQIEFVFAVVKNKGRGAATNVDIVARYDITDSSNLNRESSVTKNASIQIIESNTSVALCIFISRVPTADDKVSLVEARLKFGDFYKDAIKETAQEAVIDSTIHHREYFDNCTLRLF